MDRRDFIRTTVGATAGLTIGKEALAKFSADTSSDWDMINSDLYGSTAEDLLCKINGN